MYRIILYLLLFPAIFYGQTAQETVMQKLKFATIQFDSKEESGFIIATPYTKNYVGFSGSPFWASDVWNSADLLYNEKIYTLPELKYDCANDLMIITSYTNEGVKLLNLIPSFYPEIFINRKIKNNSESETQIRREHFIYYFATNEDKENGTPTGYYHYLIEKPVSLLCKYSSNIVDRDGQKAFIEEKKFYFMNDKKVFLIRRVDNFTEVFPQWKDKINTFAEENQIKTNLSFEIGDIKKLIEFINTLSSQK